MGEIREHPQWSHCIYWTYDPQAGWEGYNRDLDDVIDLVQSKAPDKLILLFHPSGDVPRGNPIIKNMRRLVDFSKADNNLVQMIIIMQSHWAIGRAFADLLTRLIGLEPEVKLVYSMDEAQATYNNTLASISNKA